MKNESFILFKKKWKDLFPVTILDQGKRLCNNNTVEDLRKDGEYYTAIVNFLAPNSVRFKIDNENNITDLSCTCTYASKGNMCSHMAAVLYELSTTPQTVTLLENEEEQKNEEEEELRKYLKSSVDLLSEEERCNLLVDEAMKSEEFRAKLPVPDEKEHVEHMLERSISKKVDELIDRIDRLSKDYDHIKQHEYQEVGIVLVEKKPAYEPKYNSQFKKSLWENYEYANRKVLNDLYELTKEINEDFNQIEKLEFSKKIAVQISESIDSIYSQSKDETLVKLLDPIFNLWKNIFENLNSSEREKTLEIFESDYIDQEEESFLHQLAMLVVPEYANKKEMREYILKRSDQIFFKEMLESEFTPEYVLERLKLMRELEFSEEEIAHFVDQYPENTLVLDYELERAVERNTTKSIVHLAEQRIKVTEDLKEIPTKHFEILIEAYEKLGDGEKLKELINKMIDGGVYVGRHYLKKLESLYSNKQWKKRILKLKGKIERKIYCEILYEQECYQMILTELLECNDLDEYNQLEKYERALIKSDLDTLLNKRLELMESLMGKQANRQVYREVIKRLDDLKRFREYRAKLPSVIADWRVIYKKRPAFIDELDKAGY